MAFKDLIPHSCKHCQKLIINFCGENMEEFYARHAKIRAAHPAPGPTPRPSRITDGRTKIIKFKFDVTRPEIIQGAAEGCLLCHFIFEECKLPDDCQDDEDAALWIEDLTGNSDSFDVGSVGFGWSKASIEYPHHLNLKQFLVYASQENSAGKHIVTRPINVEPGSSKSFEMARDWLSNCLQAPDHEICRRELSSFMPTRLIEIIQRPEATGSEEKLLIRLTHPQTQEPYTALSYCWGGDQPLKATRNTENSWLQCIEWTLIPQTIRDAVITSSELNIRFIWIDSLCILQDDDNDKALEISKMPQIYSNAILTITAARSSKVCDGFLQHRGLENDTTKFPDVIFEVPFQCPSGDLGAVTLLRPFKFDGEPTTTRGWTLQEGLLSSRVLEIGTLKTTWYCQYTNHKISYTDGWRVIPFRRDGELYVLDHDHEVFGHHFKQRNNWQYLARAVGTRSALELWLKTVNAFTYRTLTFPSDKLLAISAIAEKYGSVFNDEYLAGLWRFSLPISLLWSVGMRNTPLFPRPKEYLGPSWSWVSVDGPASLHLAWTAFQETMGVEPQSIISQVIACEVELSNEAFPYGTVTGGVVTINGLVREALRSRDNTILVNRGSNSQESIEGYRAEEWLEWKPDASDDFGSDDTEPVLLLALVKPQHGGRYLPNEKNFGGLVLQKLDDSRFRRVGMFVTGQTRDRNEPLFHDLAWPLFDNCQEQVVTII